MALARVVKIEKIEALPGYDFVELAKFEDKQCIVNKYDLLEGDLAVYIEPGSYCPYDLNFMFLKRKRIKKINMCKTFSDGLLMTATDLNLTIMLDSFGEVVTIGGYTAGYDVTQVLGITAEPQPKPNLETQQVNDTANTEEVVKPSNFNIKNFINKLFKHN